MKRVLDWLRDSVERRAFPTPLPPLSELKKTEWSDEFEQLMRNRLLMGAFRYGLMERKSEQHGQWKMIDSIRKRVDLYEQTGNLEPLVDLANLCLVEYVMARHAGGQLEAVDDGEHVEFVAGG